MFYNIYFWQKVTEIMIRKIFIFLLLSCFLVVNETRSQVLSNSFSYEKVKEGVNYIYNTDFEKAESIYVYLKENFPQHSMTYLYKSMIIYWKNYPLLSGTPASKYFTDLLGKSIELAEEKLKLDEDDSENLLSVMGSTGLLLMHFADNGNSKEVLSIAPKAYKYIKKSFDYTSSYTDFYFITGLYNYYREAYPEAHPVYKPILLFFPEGNKKLGLKYLKTASDSAVLLKAEANIFLSGIYQNFEHDPKKALIYSKKLMTFFPDNIFFKTNHICDLLLAKRYNEAEKYISELPSVSYGNKYLQVQIDIFNGIIYEKKYKNNKRAESLYRAGIHNSEPYGDIAGQYASFAYYGLSRVCADKSDKKSIKYYRKQGRELAKYDYLTFDE